MHPTTTFWDFPWPDARHYLAFLGVVFGIYFIKTLVDAIVRSTRVHESGAVGWQSFRPVAAAYLWNTIVFWLAALCFIAAYKG